MDLGNLVDQTAKLFSLVTDNTTSVVLSVIGLLLLLLAAAAILRGLKTDPDKVPPWLKAVLFIGLVSGIGFSIAGPGLALLRVAEYPIPQVPTAQAFDNLEKNAFTSWLIRLIPYHPVLESHLAVSRLNKLGPDWLKFSFVAPYDELEGLPAAEAVRRVGGRLPDTHRLSAIIFQIPSESNVILYPGNARGLLQVIRKVESDEEIAIDRPLLKGTTTLGMSDYSELDSTEIGTWRYDSYKQAYPRYCALTHQFRCDASPTRYSARQYISDISEDWHPLGFSEKEHRDPCRRPVSDFCTASDWSAWKRSLLAKFGSRAFLLRNLELEALPKRYMIDFGDPHHQVIPAIGSR